MDTFLKNYSLGGNWVDLIFIVILLYFILSNRGLIDTVLDIAGFLFSLLLSYRLYNFFGKLLTYNFSFPPGISNAAGFFIAWFIVEIIIFFGLTLLSLHIFDRFKKNQINQILGYPAGGVHACIIFLFFVSLVFALPVKGQVKQAIIDSRTGPYFVNLSQSTEKRVKNVFGEAISESINFLTVKPQSNETLALGFRLSENQIKPDPESEAKMLELVNQERSQRGLGKLVADDTLRTDSRAYAREMFKNGFFAHVSQVDGSSPAERAARFDIEYTVLGENLAFAPDVYIAHQGLMNSEGHRKNILEPQFKKVGLGVIDGGYYGKMFVQTFSD
jgi:uncharacterized protein YkwD